MPRVEVTRTYLELLKPGDLVAAPSVDPRLRLERVQECPASFHRYLYAAVGRAYHWVDRLGWTDEETLAYLASPTVSLWVLYFSGAPAGYFELKRHEDGSVEIAYFGLLPEYTRRGFGKHLLSEAVTQAWAQDARRVWLHTCTLDDAAALPNYLARGFRPFKTEGYVADVP
jgi:GNAT superfamily N-acetyltransferase